MTRFEGKIAVVTGGGHGIGAAVTRQLVREGATVIVATRGNASEGLGELPPERTVIANCDVSQEADVDRVFEMCGDRFGRLDLLVNNAGIAYSGRRIHETPVGEWDDVMNVNLRGAFLVMRRAIALMLQSGGGAIVNTASIGGLQPSLGTTPYSITKAAMIMMSRQAALEYARDNIRVNAVCPGTTLTPMLAGGGADLIAKKEAITPIGKLALPEEVSELMCFLLSDAAPSMTGGVHTIAGGREA